MMIRRPGHTYSALSQSTGAEAAPNAAAVSPANEIGRICTWVADTAIPVLVTGEARTHGLARVSRWTTQVARIKTASATAASNGPPIVC